MKAQSCSVAENRDSGPCYSDPEFLGRFHMRLADQKARIEAQRQMERNAPVPATFSLRIKTVVGGCDQRDWSVTWSGSNCSLEHTSGTVDGLARTRNVDAIEILLAALPTADSELRVYISRQLRRVESLIEDQALKARIRAVLLP